MKQIISVMTLLCLVLLQACATTPEPTLQLEDVPALFTTPVNSNASVPGIVDSADVTVAKVTEGSSDKVSETAESNLGEIDEILDDDNDDAHSGQEVMVVNTVNDDSAKNDDMVLGNSLESCSTIAEEISRIDEGLGSPAIDGPPNTESPSGLERTGSFVYNLTTQTVLGVLQPIIQTKRAIFNDDEKERRMTESVQRGTTRRAYLLGYAQATGCNKVDAIDGRGIAWF